jgi:hypothetical protein
VTTTDAFSHGPLAVGGSADVEFVHGPAVASDVQFLWDFDGDGDFDSDEEDITEFVLDAESSTGRDWPSQLQGKASPGRLKLRLNNDDDRFSYFNSASPLNQGGRSLDPGRRIRVQIDGTTDVDPVLLVHDRFDGGGSGTGITTDELGTTWEHQTATPWVKIDAADGDGVAVPYSGGGTESLMVIDTGETDYYAQVTITEAGDNFLAEAGFQEVNDIRLVYRWQDASNYSYLRFGPADTLQLHQFEGVDVVAGVASTIYGPNALVSSGGAGVDSAADHRRRVTIGVALSGTEVRYYVNGCRYTTQTAIQTDETHVGLYGYFGVGNRSPAVTEFAVWDRFPAAVEGVLWTGQVVDVFPEVTPGPAKVVTVTAEGMLTQAAGATIRPEGWAGRQFTGIGIGAAAEQAGLLYPPGELSGGAAVAGSSSNAEITALAHMRKLEEVEIGFLHEAPEGWLVYRNRIYRDSLGVSATFSDDDGAQYQYEGFELLQWRRELINRVSAGVSYGPPNLVSGGFAAAGTASGVARSITWTFPGSVNDGDLFIILIASTIADADEDWLVPIFWVRNRDTGASASKRSQIYTHIAASSEAGNVVTFYNDSSAAGGSFVLHFIQIRDWYGTHEGIEIGEFARGESFAGADPEAILPSWGDINPSYFSAYRAGTSTGGAGSVSADSTYPLGYTNSGFSFQNGSGSNIHDVGLQEASKRAMAAIEDPSSFTGFSGLNDAETAVVAVRGRNGSPPEPRGRLRVTVEDVASQRKHNTVASYDACDLFPSEDLAETWCELMLTRYANLRPVVRLSFTATRSTSYRLQAYQRRLSDKVTLIATGNAGMGINGDFHIESIRHRWSQGTKLWETTWELSPAD